MKMKTYVSALALILAVVLALLHTNMERQAMIIRLETLNRRDSVQRVMILDLQRQVSAVIEDYPLSAGTVTDYLNITDSMLTKPVKPAYEP